MKRKKRKLRGEIGMGGKEEGMGVNGCKKVLWGWVEYRSG